MGVVLESEQWVLQPFWYLALFFLCFSSVFLFPYFSNNARANQSSVIDAGPSAPFLRFQRSFLLLYSLASLISGLEYVFGDYEYQHYGMSRGQIVLCLSVGVAVSFLIGTFLGMVSDVIGPRKACMIFCALHLVVGVLKSVTKHPSLLITSICLSLASSILSFCFETWMVVEHEKQGHRQDLLTDTFWLMTFSESSSLIGSQVLANFLVKDVNKGVFVPSTPAALLALLSIIYISKEWSSSRPSFSIRNYCALFYGLLGDRRIWILALAQGFLHFSMSIFWILWAPTMVADGREVQLSLMYPCFLGSKMLGSTAIPWFFNGSSPYRNDDWLTAAFVISAFCLAIVAYDYQEIGVLMILFCMFCACTGLIIPSLARLRTMYVPNELRGGMISLSFAPSHAAILFFLLQGGYHRNVSNSTMIAFAAGGLFSGAGCIHALKRWRKQTLQNRHKI